MPTPQAVFEFSRYADKDDADPTHSARITVTEIEDRGDVVVLEVVNEEIDPGTGLVYSTVGPVECQIDPNNDEMPMILTKAVAALASS